MAAGRAVTRGYADLLRASAVASERAGEMAGAEVGQTPGEVVYEENKLELVHYEPLTDTQHDVPILVVYALINRPYILDLQPDRSVVRRLLEAGHDVYLIRWGEPSRLDASLGLYDYVGRYLDNCVDVVRGRSGRDSINLLGYCMGGTFSAIYAAIHPEKVTTLGLMAAALYFDDTGGVLELWGDEEYYDPRGLADAYGTIPAEFLAQGFAVMDPVSNYLTKYVHLLEGIENEDFAKNFARMERWLSDGVDVAGAVYAEFLEEIYQRNSLARNELELGGEHVDVTAIDVPVLQIVGEFDNLVPPEASLGFNDVIPGEVTVVEYPTGHVGLSMSASAHRDLWPEVAEWFLEHSIEPTYADVIGQGVEEALGYDVETDVTTGGATEVEIRIADADGELARGIVRRDLDDVRTFVEEALDVSIDLADGDDDVTVAIRDGEADHSVSVPDLGTAISGEVRESVEDADVAAAVDLLSISGIGPTYARRLREAGIETVAALASADPSTVAEAAEASRSQARDWIDAAADLAE